MLGNLLRFTLDWPNQNKSFNLVVHICFRLSRSELTPKGFTLKLLFRAIIHEKFFSYFLIFFSVYLSLLH